MPDISKLENAVAGLGWAEAKICSFRVELDQLSRFSYSGSCISPGGRASNKVSWCIFEARMPVNNFSHLWRRSDIRSLNWSRVCTAVISILLNIPPTTYAVNFVAERYINLRVYWSIRTVGYPPSVISLPGDWHHKWSNYVRVCLCALTSTGGSAGKQIVLEGWRLQAVCQIQWRTFIRNPFSFVSFPRFLPWW